MICEAIRKANPHIQEGEINIQSVRAGSIFGEHEVVFANKSDEVITMKHQVSSRKGFSDGVLLAAEWLIKQPARLYTMYDFMNGARGK